MDGKHSSDINIEHALFYADDTKVFRVVKNLNDRFKLQKDIHYLQWMNELGIGKRTNPERK